MIRTREATATIKGHYYQFDLFILELLQLPNDDDRACLEGIEDVNRIIDGHIDDVLSAWENQYRSVSRETDAGARHVAVGYDSKGREIEMVAVELEEGDWLVYHAMTPPSDRTREELGMGKRR